MVQYDTLRYFMILHVAVRMGCDIVQYDSLRYGAVQYVFVQYGTIHTTLLSV